MTGPERGFLLLCAELGDGRKPLTLAQLRDLRARVRAAGPPEEPDRPLSGGDLRALGCTPAFAERVLDLMSRDRDLEAYLGLARELGIRPLTLPNPSYPARLRRLGDAAPPVLFVKGDPALLARPSVALVGSRSLTPEGAAFARRVGELAAEEGLLLVSGNAQGADQTAQEACLAAGGSVAAILPDSLSDSPTPTGRTVYLCEWGWHLPMATYRALGRNRLIHVMGEKTLVAQSGLAGGTWRGSTENLRRGWSPLFVNAHGGPGCAALLDLGATGVSLETLTSLSALKAPQISLLPGETTIEI